MPSGQSTAQVTPEFNDFLEEIRKHASDSASGMTGDGLRSWFSTGTSPSDLENAHKPLLDRDEVNAEYAALMSSVAGAGTVADVIAVKKQVDYMAAAERAFRLRHCAVPRALAHAAGRRSAHAKTSFEAVERSLAATIRAGSQNNE